MREVDVGDLAFHAGDLPLLTGRFLLGHERRLPARVALAERQQALGGDLIAAHGLVARQHDAPLLQFGLGSQLVQFEPQLADPGKSLLGFGIEPVDLQARLVARGLRFRLELLHQPLADIAGGGLGRHANFGQRHPLVDLLAFLHRDDLNESGDRHGRLDEALVGNQPSVDGGLAGVGRHRGEHHAGDDDPAEQETEQADRQGCGEDDCAGKPSRCVCYGFLAEQLAHPSGPHDHEGCSAGCGAGSPMTQRAATLCAVGHRAPAPLVSRRPSLADPRGQTDHRRLNPRSE